MLVISGIAAGIYYWSKLPDNNLSVPANLPPQETITLTGVPDNDQRPADEQISSLEAIKTVTPQIVIPSVLNQSSISRAQLPQSLTELIGINAGNLSINQVSYTGKTSGYEIVYIEKNNLVASFLDFVKRSKAGNWTATNMLASAKARLANLQNEQFLVRAEFIPANSMVKVKISVVSK